MSMGLSIVPRTATAIWFEPSEFQAMYARFALSGLSASRISSHELPVAKPALFSCAVMPSLARWSCSCRDSPDGRGVAAVAAIAERVMVTWAGVGADWGAFGIRAP